MRTAMLLLTAVLALAVPVSAHTLHAWSGPVVAAATTTATVQQQPTKDYQVDINVNRGGRAWYMSPLWIAIGALALVVLLVLIILAVRGGGGGTTIVRE